MYYRICEGGYVMAADGEVGVIAQPSGGNEITITGRTPEENEKHLQEKLHAEVVNNTGSGIAHLMPDKDPKVRADVANIEYLMRSNPDELQLQAALKQIEMDVAAKQE